MACFDEHLELPEQRDAPVPRGWSMKLGHRKRHSARATVSEVVLCGRSTVKRSVNSGRRWENPGFWEKKVQSCRQWRSVVDDMMDAVSELETDDIWLAWEVSEDEGLWNDMEEVEEDFDDCSSADLSTTASTCELPVKYPTRWEKALEHAQVVAKGYRDGPAETATSRKSENEKMKDPEVQRVAQTLQAQRVKLCCPELQHRLHDTFEEFRMSFLEKFGETLSRGLQSCYVGDVELRAAPVNKSLQSRFLSCKDKQPDTLSPVLHGTDERNLPSIYQKGLLVPAGDNNVKVLHGSSHGRGIYTSKTNNTALSFGFSKGLARPLLICAVLDDAVALPSPVRCGNHYITAESAQVRHVGDAIVVFDESKLLPLFVASYPTQSLPKQVTTSTATSATSATIVRDPPDVPPDKKKHSVGPRTRLKPTQGLKSRVQEAVDYLQRRGARKRRP
ncbi:unnamed protein product [Durusdinium trenchii]|uniref:PARP catalytic domain-containing protein n=2 Tax=Durusdinium trenchii TaxID=1381693 RepID=A0ABP0HWS3_9DINO